MRRRFKPTATRPRDFTEFWRQTLTELDAVEPEPQRRVLESRAEDGLRLEEVSFRSLDGARITALLTTGTSASPRPLVIHSHGYGGSCEPQWGWARAGVDVLGVDIRGFGRSHDALVSPSHWGWILTGIGSPETSVLRGAVCDYVRAAQVAPALVEEPLARTIFQGVSFAGGLALMAAAVLDNPNLVAVGVPTFGWTEGRFLFVKSGSGAQVNHYLSYHPERLDDVMLVLRYFDPVNFADQITCPTVVGVGLADDVVPAKTVYAIANHLAGPQEIMEFPVSHTDLPEEQLWERFEDYWLRLAIQGAEAGFGD